MNMDDKVLENFICMINAFDKIELNKDKCKTLRRQSSKISICKNQEKRSNYIRPLKEKITELAEKYKDSILERDFTFLDKDNLIFEETNLSELYNNIIDSGDESKIKLATAELLFLFYSVLDDESKKIIDEKYRKKDIAVAKPSKKGQHLSSIMDEIPNILGKSKDLLSEAENDPKKVLPAVKTMIKNGHFDDVINKLIGNIQ